MKLDFADLFFSHLPKARRRRELRSFLFVLVVALLFAGCIALLMVYANRTGGQL